MATSQTYCTFTLAGSLYGIPVGDVQEVLRAQEITPLPLAPPSVSGLINLRGHIVVAIDLRSRLGLPARPADQLPMNVVLQTADGPVSLLVDDIEDMVEVPQEQCEAPPPTLRGPGQELIVGTYQLARRLLLILDTHQTLELPPSVAGGANVSIAAPMFPGVLS
jgi:purine-binding chemotaxis protein CheW